MNRDDFIEKLRISLNGRVDPQTVNENLEYYNEYISIQMREGKSERQVLEELGDPRLLAKSIITASGASRDEEDYEDDAGAYHDGPEYYNTGAVRVKKIPGWVELVIVLAIIFLILGLVVSVLSFLLPILLPIFVVLFFVKLFRDWLN